MQGRVGFKEAASQSACIQITLDHFEPKYQSVFFVKGLFTEQTSHKATWGSRALGHLIVLVAVSVIVSLQDAYLSWQCQG